jgi:Acyl-CoA synthetases (AMP-forming)/AMP-acid ligases II
MTEPMTGIYPGGGSMIMDSLPNNIALSPVDFLKRANRAYRNRVAVIDGDHQMTYGQFHDRAMALAGGLEDIGLQPGDYVAVLCPNSAAMLEAHYAIPAAGMVINALNTRLDPASIAYILGHAGAKMLMVHPSLSGPIADILDQCDHKPILVLMDWKDLDGGAIGQDLTYEALLARGAAGPSFVLQDELHPIAINYTSGTTGRPKGARYTHRGAFLNALGNALTLGLQPTSRYLWTLPLFHCNGWTHSWGVTAAGATHVCLPRIDAADIFARIADHHVTHMAMPPL